MQDILIRTDKAGGTAILTTASPMSHYGSPVLRIDANDIKGDFVPADILTFKPKPLTAADVVADWAAQDDRTEEELSAARKFLSQWPDGPQLWGGYRPGSGRKPAEEKRKPYSFRLTKGEHAKVKDFIAKLKKEEIE